MLQVRDSLMQRQPAAHSEYVHGNQKRIEIQRLAIPVRVQRVGWARTALDPPKQQQFVS